MGRLASHPNFATLEMFFLPNRDDFLKPVNSEAASLESLGAVGGGDRDSNRNLANFHRDRRLKTPLQTGCCSAGASVFVIEGQALYSGGALCRIDHPRVNPFGAE